MFSITNIYEYANIDQEEFIRGESKNNIEIIIDDNSKFTFSELMQRFFEKYGKSIFEQVKNIPVTQSVAIPSVSFVTTKNALLAINEDKQIVGIKFLAWIAIDPAFQRRGLGSDLLAEYLLRGGVHVFRWPQNNFIVYSSSGLANRKATYRKIHDRHYCKEKLKRIQEATFRPVPIDLTPYGGPKLVLRHRNTIEAQHDYMPVVGV